MATRAKLSPTQRTPAKKDTTLQDVPTVPQGLTPGETPQGVFERAMKALERGRKKYRNTLRALKNAPVRHDESLTEDDRKQIRQAREDIRAGRFVTHEEIIRKRLA